MNKIPELSKLSIIKPTRELIIDIARYVKNMPKEYKMPYGITLSNDSLELLNYISLANIESSLVNKSSHISNLIRLTRKIEVLLGVLSDLKLLGIKQESSMAKNIAIIISQSTNWYNKVNSLMSDREKV